MTKAEREELQKTSLIEMRAAEDELHVKGIKYIAGIDEVGRGPLAGPVYAAAVVLPEGFDVLGINDSKKLSAKKREELSAIIKERATAYGIGIADNHEIDELNILNATKLAMKRAIKACNDRLAETGGEIEQLMIDAVKLDVDIPQESIIKGDAKCLCIAAASIVAKVARDAYMEEMDGLYPGYDFASNKGYGTAAHYEGLREIGFTPIHRRTFLKKFEEEQAGDRAAAWGNKEKTMAKKVYAVKKGRETGIFMDWDTCRKQVDGYPGAEYKSFADANDALAYLGLASSKAEETFGESTGTRAYVDGSYDAATGRYSCGVVIVDTDENGNVQTYEMNACYDDREAAEQRNVAGEIMGAKLAIDYCKVNGIDTIEIYHDYEGVGKWADDLWKANNPLTKGYKAYVAEARETMAISFVKVKAHAGNKYNELADGLAKEALKK
ncbi:MAG: ribonuclease HII [Clostridiales bacterium]|nr:ribonuclease HII [Candidatus Crickella caballi]